MNWFSTYQGADWNPEKHGFNERFRIEVQAIRALFHLKKVKPGLEESTGVWLQIKLHHGNTNVYVHVKKFDWLNRWSSGCVYFALDTEMAEEGVSLLGSKRTVVDAGAEKKVALKTLWNYELLIRFETGYPLTEPAYYINNSNYKNHPGSAHSHHILNGGQLCLFGSSGDWRPSEGTALSGFNSAMDLMYGHYKQYGW